jgi:hypothetical protein
MLEMAKVQKFCLLKFILLTFYQQNKYRLFFLKNTQYVKFYTELFFKKNNITENTASPVNKKPLTRPSPKQVAGKWRIRKFDMVMID